MGNYLSNYFICSFFRTYNRMLSSCCHHLWKQDPHRTPTGPYIQRSLYKILGHTVVSVAYWIIFSTPEKSHNDKAYPEKALKSCKTLKKLQNSTPDYNHHPQIHLRCSTIQNPTECYFLGVFSLWCVNGENAAGSARCSILIATTFVRNMYIRGIFEMEKFSHQ